mgnify:CR=1 FL=1|jgi:hypothetical protein
MAKIICLDSYSKDSEGYKQFQIWLYGIDGCCQITENCWVVTGAETTKEVAKRLADYLGSNARVFVANLEKGSCNWRNIIDSDHVLQGILKS